MMQITIINNTKGAAATNIWPVLSAGDVAAQDEWLEACFGTTQNQIDAGQKYPRQAQYRFYINPENGGIPPGGSVTVNLPIYSLLASNPDPTKPGQYIDWWQGGRVEIFVNPTYLNLAYTDRTNQTVISPINTGGAAVIPNCSTPCTIKFFGAYIVDQDNMVVPKSGLSTALPTQLTEYTLWCPKPRPHEG
jgi:hypothetical protein